MATITETKEQRRARLEQELKEMDAEDREKEIESAAQETTLGDVVEHLVQNSRGYASIADREAHLRAVRRLFAEPAADGADSTAEPK